MKKVMWLIGVPVVSLVSGFVGGAAILVWGLVTPFFIVWPLALGTTALWSAVGAGWAGTFLAPDYTRSRLLRVLLVSGIVAVVLATVLLVAPALFGEVFLPLIWLFTLSAILIAVAASVATWRFRGSRGRLGWWVLGPLALSALVLVVALASLTGVLGVFGIWEWQAMLLVSSVNLGAVMLGAILMRRLNRAQGDQTSKDAAVTLILVGLPVSVFYPSSSARTIWRSFSA